MPDGFPAPKRTSTTIIHWSCNDSTHKKLHVIWHGDAQENRKCCNKHTHIGCQHYFPCVIHMASWTIHRYKLLLTKSTTPTIDIGLLALCLLREFPLETVFSKESWKRKEAEISSLIIRTPFRPSGLDMLWIVSPKIPKRSVCLSTYPYGLIRLHLAFWSVLSIEKGVFRRSADKAPPFAPRWNKIRYKRCSYCSRWWLQGQRW